MENYPDIQRRNGTLFFACPEDSKAAIATSIERLIDMLDAMEDDPDLEPYLAGTSGPYSDDREGDLDAHNYPGMSEGDDNPDDEDGGDDERTLGWHCNDDQSAGLSTQVCEDECEFDAADDEPMLGALLQGDQTHWGQSSLSDREDDGDDMEPSFGGLGTYINGKLEYELEQDNADREPSLGWTAERDQSSPQRFGDVSNDCDREHDDSDREPNGDEGDHSCDPEESFWIGGSKDYDGSGVFIALDMIRGLPSAARRSEVYMTLGFIPHDYDFKTGARAGTTRP